MMECAGLLAGALGGLTAEGLNAVARALSYLGIGVLDGSKTLSVSVNVGASRGDSMAGFDFNTRRWLLVSPLPAYQDDVVYAQLKPGADDSDMEESELSEACPDEITLSDDWTRQLPRTSHVDFIKGTDWSATALGPMRSWQLPLRLMVHKVLADPRPANLYW